MKSPKELKAKILALTREYSHLVHSNYRPANDPGRAKWKEGQAVPYAGRVFQEEEVEAAVSSTLDFWLTLGSEGKAFEKELAKFLGVKYSILVNSGSSANLVAISSLTSYKLPTKKRINRGDEVITAAAGFPTTVAPIIQVGAVPVFIDTNPITGNAKCEQLESAYSPGKTKAVMLAHALGNPFDLATTIRFCRKYDLWLIEDNCDALGSSYSIPRELAKELGYTQNSPGLSEGPDRISRWTGSWGDISTQSFYPPHHLTMGEGGAINIAKNSDLKIIVESFRDWGRDCWCPSGIDNTCKKRFEWKLGKLPFGYDHKYTYSHLGYNLKPLDYQAAIGRVQLKRLANFNEARKMNWYKLRSGLDLYKSDLGFTLPTHAISWDRNSGFSWDSSGCRSECSWFGFKVEVSPNAAFSRNQLAEELDRVKIGNRVFFGGNLLRQPAFVELLKNRSDAVRISSDLSGSDQIMNRSIFLGTYPGLTDDMLNFEISIIKDFIRLNVKPK